MRVIHPGWLDWAGKLGSSFQSVRLGIHTTPPVARSRCTDTRVYPIHIPVDRATPERFSSPRHRHQPRQPIH